MLLQKSGSLAKKTGATFTPPKLADYLSDKIISYYGDLTNKVVLDPACGNGSLLTSIAKKTDFSVGTLVGFDTNNEFVEDSREILRNIGVEDYVIENQDFLAISNEQTDLFSNNSLENFADVVIANPPYVRTQNLGGEKSRQLSKKFHLSGKVDLYYPFLVGMTNVLKFGGLLGVITSNRYLMTKSGADIRKLLLANYDILEVIDLGDTQLFDAAVLPAILIGRKKSIKTTLGESVCRFAKLYEGNEKVSGDVQMVSSVYEILAREVAGTYKIGNKLFEYTTGILTLPSNTDDVWALANDEENRFLDIVRENTCFYIRDRFKVRVGIKSCADKVFLKSQWDASILSEQEMFKPLISRENIQRWSCDTSKLTKVLYPHYEKDGVRFVYDIDRFPKVKEYLLDNRCQLEGRKYLLAAGRKWYEMWVPQSPSMWNLPKIVFPDISVEAQFAYDESGAVVNGNCYWIAARTEEEKKLLLLLQGVANSDLMKKYHDLCFNNKLYSGRRRYLSQYVEKYPLPNPDSVYSQNIIKIVKELNATKLPVIRLALNQELNKNVNKAFGIKD